MDSRLLLCTLFALILIGGCCEDDYDLNKPFHIYVPVETFLESNTIQVGDTFAVRFDFSKDLEVRTQNKTVRLENFNFHSALAISEISDTLESSNFDLSHMYIRGNAERVRPSFAYLFYFDFAEDEDSYAFEIKFAIETPGLYYISIGSDLLTLAEEYNHPALYDCRGDRRYNIAVYFDNPNTTKENYEDYYLQTEAPYLLDNDFERYSRLGAHTFRVVE